MKPNYIVALILLGTVAIAINKKLQEPSKTVFAKDHQLVLNETKPNILFLCVDDLRPELGAYGSSQIHSPAIDKLAKNSFVFNNAFCNVPVCGASRASLLTGLLPKKNRFIDYKTHVDLDTPGVQTLPQTFKESGYATYSFGKVFHHKLDCADRSWSEVPYKSGISHKASLDSLTTYKQVSKSNHGLYHEQVDVGDYEYTDGRMTQAVIEKLKDLSNKKEPFFLAAGFIRPHLPFYAPKKYWDLYDPEKIELADNPYAPKNAPSSLHGSGEFKMYYIDKEIHSKLFHRTMRHGYYASISYVDKLIGDIIFNLEQFGLAENTIIILWGDHGWHLGEHNFWGKHNTMNLALKVPLIIKLPNQKRGVALKSIIETVDIFPTLTGLAKIEAPHTLQGKSFESLFVGAEDYFREAAYSRFKKADAITTARYGYSEFELDDGGKEIMLFDHETDPNENTNIANESNYQDVVKRMQNLLVNSIQRSKDKTLSE